MMPLQANLKGQPGLERYEETVCPRCKADCFFDRRLIWQAYAIYSGRMIALCSHCALKSYCDKTFIPSWLQKTGKTVRQVLEGILGQEQEGQA